MITNNLTSLSVEDCHPHSNWLALSITVNSSLVDLNCQQQICRVVERTMILGYHISISTRQKKRESTVTII